MSDTKKISIVLIDDHTIFRSGIKSLLSHEDDFEIIGEAADGLSGVKIVQQLAPDVVLLDLDMPVMNGREALAQILSVRPEQCVVMLTVSEDGEDLLECIRMGANGFLLKNINADFLTESIRNAAEGNNVFSPEMVSNMVQSLIRPNKPAEENRLEELTSRELDVLGCLAAGHSNKIIARNLDLAESTVKVYVQNILRKLELTSRVQAAVYAVQHNVPLPDFDE
ncbi:response regulator [Neisseria sp. 23W00296]|uniref:response regulator n=1 Tax=unclassified Neisseria TaxID=2623750 RepID=UPI0002A452E1|nr:MULTISPECIES: response regulator transcription factor [unclassified Neisseria]ASP17781.1 DNA-binding response regulator [Neisseria sp. KEM232]EKY09942.1 putative nitrate/nitrite response regulator protein NarL [Neisseria sp. oral taxon 020 str. F0370]